MNEIQKNWKKYLAIGGGGLLLIIVLVIIFATPGPDISGRYELLIGGQRTDTVIQIEPKSGSYEIQFLENDVVRSHYVMPKPRGGRFTIEQTLNDKPGDRFDLEIVNGGLKGKADIATLAKGIDVFFRKVQ